MTEVRQGPTQPVCFREVSALITRCPLRGSWLYAYQLHFKYKAAGRAFNLRFVLPPTCVDLRWPALIDFGRAQIRMQVDANRRKFFTVWPPNASRHKLPIASQLYMREIHDFLRLPWTCEPTCESVWPPIASPHASFGFANLRWLASTCESVWPGLTAIFPTLVYWVSSGVPITRNWWTCEAG